ncbi:hypothetical protein CYMTET_32376 [Cymbomonas tetramitiformis]|uniref:DNA (cytosine-5-)-methyltransferase n=1 Tax=Cymbomonas tetramitiformis TaxID=36881 RepID=A0AAE0FF65_9CHLO|nr:hypothetical protein CYMTET_32376 [Cymbomonas tetramitiformis]
MPRSENEWKTREDLEWDGAGRPGVPNRALLEFERIEAKRVEREKLRVRKRRDESAGAVWTTLSEELKVDGAMPWVPEERFDEEVGTFARVSAQSTLPPVNGAAALEKEPVGQSKILVLFCGTGSVERQFTKQFIPNSEVVAVDIQPKWGPTHCEDIMRWDYRQFRPGHFDVVWASPPCTEYSQAKTVGIRDLRAADRRVRRTLEIIRYLRPEAYFIENPKGREPHGLHTRRCMSNLPAPHLVTYCKYGTAYRKPTHIRTNVPLRTPLRVCDSDTPCEFFRQHGRHEKVAQGGRAMRAGGVFAKGMGARENLYGIPSALLKQLFHNLTLHEEVHAFLSELLVREDLSEMSVLVQSAVVESDPPEFEPEPIALAGVRAEVTIIPEGGWESDASGLSD